jgi:hypothetical protein
MSSAVSNSIFTNSIDSISSISGALTIGTGGTESIAIGSATSLTTVGNTLGVTGMTTTGGLTLGGASNITLSSGITPPTTPSQLFSSYSIIFSGSALPATMNSIGSLPAITQAGTYWVMWHYEYSFVTTLPTSFYLTLSRSNTMNNTMNTNAQYGFDAIDSISTPKKASLNGQQIFTQTDNSSTIYGASIIYSGGEGVSTFLSANSYFRMFRIA